MERQAHFLRELERDGLPHRHAFLDTEARVETRGATQEQRFELGVLSYADLDPRRRSELCREELYTQLEPLWSDLLGFAPRGRRLCVWAHNLAYDLRISQALRFLPAAGYRLRGIVLERTASWAWFVSPERSLIFCDLASWLPAPLAAIAADVGLRKPAGAPETGDPARLEERCRADVRVLRAAVIELLGWLRAERLGPFRPTGAGQSHTAFRRRFLSDRVLVHDDQEVLETERRAMWTGRAEAWRWGALEGGPFIEYDLELAYCRIAAERAVPVALKGRARATDLDSLLELSERYAVLAECEVETALECLPAERASFIAWPVGRFETALFDPELRLAADAGAEIRVKQAWLYRRSPALRGFASWVLDALEGRGQPVSPVVRRALKHWSRSLVGRLALRYRRWEQFGWHEHYGLRLGTLYDRKTGEVTDLLHAGRDVLELTQLAESQSSLPQITGWIMAECRRRLWTLIELAGRENLLYVDTDSLIVTQDGARRLERAAAVGLTWSLRRKGVYSRLEIHGPRHLVVEGHARISGVPKRSLRVGVLEWEGEIWRGLKESLARGELDHVVVTPRRFKVRATDRRREHLGGGATRAFRLG